MKQIPTNMLRLFVLSLLIIPSCLDEISLPVPDSNLGNLVIQGKLIEGNPSRIHVSISRLNNYADTPVTAWEPVSKVRLEDEEENRIDLIRTAAGRYELSIPKDHAGFRIHTGRSYRLVVVDLDDRIYASSWEPLHAVPLPERLNVRLEQREELNDSENIVANTYLRYEITTSLSVPGEGRRAFLKWDFAGCYRFIESNRPGAIIPTARICYVEENLKLSEIVLFNGNASTSDILEDFELMEDVGNHRYARGYYFTAYQRSLSEGAYHYWSRVAETLDRNGSLFEDPPGKVKGNFNNISDPGEEVFGYFYASQVDTIRRFVSMEEAGYPKPFCPEPAPSLDIEAVCFDCLLLFGSSYDKPDYWTQ